MTFETPKVKNDLFRLQRHPRLYNTSMNEHAELAVNTWSYQLDGIW